MQVNTVPDFSKMAQELKDDALLYAEVKAENFFKETFMLGGFTDVAFEKWADRKTEMTGFKTLQLTGALRDSVSTFSEQALYRVIVQTDMPYSEIHNEGGTINVKVTPKMRKYFWAMFKASGQERWKGMAMTKKTQFTIRIPKRQFIGESFTLMATLDDWLAKEIEKRFKQIKT